MMQRKTVIASDLLTRREEVSGRVASDSFKYVHINDFGFTRTEGRVLATTNVRSCTSIVVYAPEAGLVGLGHLRGTAPRGFDMLPCGVRPEVAARLQRAAFELSAEKVWTELVVPILDKLERFRAPYLVWLGGGYSTEGNTAASIHQRLLKHKESSPWMSAVVAGPTCRAFRRDQMPRCTIRVRRGPDGLEVEEQVVLGAVMDPSDMPLRYPGDRVLPRRFTYRDQTWEVQLEEVDIGGRSGFWAPVSIANVMDLDAMGTAAVARARKAADDRMWGLFLEECLAKGERVFRLEQDAPSMQVGKAWYRRPRAVLWLDRPRNGGRPLPVFVRTG